MAREASDITILAATDRAQTDATPPVFGGDRGTLRYERFTIRQLSSAEAAAQANGSIARYRDPSKVFVTTGRHALNRSDFVQAIGQADATDKTIGVFVHGYNTSYQEAVFRLAQLSAETDRQAVPILFSWPSQGDFRGYVADRDSATYARDDLVELLTMLSRSHAKGNITLVGHSMGAWLVMEAVRQLRLQGRDDVVNRLQIGLAAPDIDIDVFRNQVAAVGRLSPPITVLVSRDDRALAVSSRLAGGKPRLGLASADDPQIKAMAERDGVRIIDITSLPSINALNHDRFVVFAARYSHAAQVGAFGELAQAGAFLLNATGRILLAPPTRIARIIERSP
ncbi:alpha/beta hydrolase [Paracoccus sp. M683]|uniref:alpha/beta hydrolase n=1 Tax=Paracoccus sp. M683 TaxID=2594268 RepID=UPI00163DCA5E|nr:alpha/beta fold hydrolase [Paracoccus sp. M683]